MTRLASTRSYLASRAFASLCAVPVVFSLLAAAAPARAHAEETSATPGGPPSAGAPVFVGNGSAKLSYIGAVQASAHSAAGSAHTVDAPTSTAGRASVLTTPRRRISAVGGAAETSELLAHHHDELAACLPATADPAGVVLVKAQVAADGHALSADVSAFNGVTSSVASCLAVVAAKVTFESHGARAAVVPLRLAVSEMRKPSTTAASATSARATPGR